MLSQKCIGQIFAGMDAPGSGEAELGRLTLKKQQYVAEKRLLLELEAFERRRQRSLEAKRSAEIVWQKLLQQVVALKARAQVKRHCIGTEV